MRFNSGFFVTRRKQTQRNVSHGQAKINTFYRFENFNRHNYGFGFEEKQDALLSVQSLASIAH
jgi:hypothetical protein